MLIRASYFTTMLVLVVRGKSRFLFALLVTSTALAFVSPSFLALACLGRRGHQLSLLVGRRSWLFWGVWKTISAPPNGERPVFVC